MRSFAASFGVLLVVTFALIHSSSAESTESSSPAEQPDLQDLNCNCPTPEPCAPPEFETTSAQKHCEYSFYLVETKLARNKLQLKTNITEEEKQQLLSAKLELFQAYRDDRKVIIELLEVDENLPAGVYEELKKLTGAFEKFKILLEKVLAEPKESYDTELDRALDEAYTKVKHIGDDVCGAIL